MSKAEEKIIQKRVGRRIKIIRKIKGLSLKELGKALDVTLQQVQKYESGTTRIPVEKLLMISRIFNVSINVFFEEKLHA